MIYKRYYLLYFFLQLKQNLLILLFYLFLLVQIKGQNLAYPLEKEKDWEAIESIISAAKKQKDTSNIIAAYAKQVRYAVDLNMETQALNAFRNMNEMREKYPKNVSEISTAFESIAAMYTQKKEFFIAASYLERGLKITTDQDKILKFNILLAQAYLNEKKPELLEKAKEKLDIAKKLNENVQNAPLNSFLELTFSQYFSSTNQNQKAIIYAFRALDILEKNNLSENKCEVYQTLYNAFLIQKNNEKALLYLQKYLVCKEAEKDISNLDGDVLLKNKQREKKGLEDAVLLEKKENLLQKYKFAALTFALFCVLIICMLVFTYFKNRRKIAAQNKEITAINNELVAFNYSVSHDLKVPLVKITSIIRRMERLENEKLSEKMKSNLSILHQTTETTRKMLDEMMMYSLTDNQTFTPVRFDTKEVVEDLMYQFDVTIKAKNITVRIAPDIPDAFGDVAMIRQVFQNLISNAIKFSNPNTASFIEIGGKKQQKNLIFSVSDNGVGFNMEHKNKLFQLFKRLHTSKQIEGNGAGLAIVKRIIERHGGEVWAESSQNRGAVFYFSLPKLS